MRGDGVLSELSRARRSNRAARLDLLEAIYKAYITAIGCGVAVLLVSDAVGDHRLAPAAVQHVADRGPALVGLLVTAIVIVGLRSGARGGPLVLPGAEVRYVLLAPIDRRQVLRPPGRRHLRMLAGGGAVIGAVMGVQAAHRLPGGIAAWAACGALVGMVAAVLSGGAALTCAGRHVPPWAASLLSVGLLAWSCVDVALHVHTSPATAVGLIALWPLRTGGVAVGMGMGVVALAALLAVAGVGSIAGLRLEAAERRAALASQIRFALTSQDLRTVVLLRRQLTQENPRTRPWAPLGPLHARRFLVWSRDVHGLARWPAVRVARVLTFGLVAGACLVGVWAGTTPLIVVAALVLFLGALEAIEPLAQDIDHPDRGDSVPLPAGQVRLLHLPCAFAILLVTAACGWGLAFALGPARLVVPVGAAVLVPGALLATCGAAASIVMGPPAAGNLPLPAEVAGLRMVYRSIWPPVIVLIGLTPVLVARGAFQKALLLAPASAHGLAASTVATTTAAAVSAVSTPLLFSFLVLGWIRFREDIQRFMRESTNPTRDTAAA